MFVFKVKCDPSEKRNLHLEMCNYPFIEYLGESRIDGSHMYRLHLHTILNSRIFKINKIRKKIGLPVYNYKHEYITELANDRDVENFFQKYSEKLQMITTLEDHTKGFWGRYTVTTV